MKINAGPGHTLTLSELYCGVGIQTDAGRFSVCQRDGGIEIRLDDGPGYRWTDDSGPLPLPSPPAQEPRHKPLPLASPSPAGLMVWNEACADFDESSDDEDDPPQQPDPR